MPKEVSITEFTNEDLDLVSDFLSSNSWPFHTNDSENNSTIQTLTHNTKTFLAKIEDELVGMIKVNDFQDGETPLFDVRVAESVRGKGVGAGLVKKATQTVFNELPQTTRFEATTREDNLPMIALLQKLGWTQEARYRKAWKTPGGEYLDALGFSILREEWNTTAV